MPAVCSVRKCVRNTKTGVKLSMFRFPKDESLRMEWIKKMNRDNFVPTVHSRVCEKHFQQSDILRESSFTDSKTGQEISIRLFHPRLKPGAVPSLLLDTNITKRPAPNKRTKTLKNKKDDTGPQKEKNYQVSEKPLKHFITNDEGISGQRYSTFIDDKIIIKREPLDVDEPYAATDIFDVHKQEASKESSLFPIPVANVSPFSIKQELISYLDMLENPSMDCKFEELDSIRIENVKSIANEVDESVSSDKPRQSTEQCMSPTKDKCKGMSPPQPKLQSSCDIPEGNLALRTCEHVGDLFDSFGEYVAGKLRKLDWKFCAYALKGIVDVITKVEQDQAQNPDSSSRTN